MKEFNLRTAGIGTYGQQLALMLGIVKNNADPAQHGRLQVFIPSIDTDSFSVEDLPWAWYISPFGGVTANAKVGREQADAPGMTSYGMWAIPKVGAQVLIACIDGNPEFRVWLGCFYMPEHNRTLPAGINGVQTEIDESGTYGQHNIPIYEENLKKAGLWLDDKHFKTRGGYERSVSHPSNKNRVKPTDNGYAPKPHEPEKADSQVFSFTTPGKHYWVMSDIDKYCRMRFRTASGQQIILDDTNERIYISTGQGKNWIELDEANGKVYVYSDSKVSVRAKNDINLYSDENVNIVAKQRVNIRSEEKGVEIQAKHDVRLRSSHADVMLTASRDVHIKTTDGPRVDVSPSQQFCDASKGKVFRWSEKGGSESSSIRIDAAQVVNVRGGSSVRVSASGDVNVRSMSSVNLQGGHLNEKFGSIAVSAGSTGLNDGDPEGPFQVQANGGAGSAGAAEPAKAVSAAEVVDHMVRPDHESWVRDEDEASCKTTRNTSYQG